MKLGGYIRKERTKQNMSLRELARLARVSPAFVSNLENEKVEQPKIELLLDIFAVLNIDFIQLELFGIIEGNFDTIKLQDDVAKEKVKKVRKHIDSFLDGMDFIELKQVQLFLTEHYPLFQFLALSPSSKTTKALLDEFQTYLEFKAYKLKKEFQDVEEITKEDMDLLSVFLHKD